MNISIVEEGFNKIAFLKILTMLCTNANMHGMTSKT